MTDTVKIKGKFKWAKVVKPEMFADRETWSVCVYPDPEEMDKVFALQKAGVKNQIKKDDDGYFIKYSKPTTIKTKAGVRAQTAPTAFHKGNSFTDIIPNGSSGTVVLDTYSHKVPTGGTAKAARLSSISIDELAEMPPRDNF